MKGAYRYKFWLFLPGFFTVLLMPMNQLHAQGYEPTRWTVEGNIGMSSFRPHRSEMHLSQRGFMHADISLVRHSGGIHRWERDNNLPRVGILYGYYAFPDVAMGNAHGLLGWLGNDFVSKDWWRFYWQMGFGLGYLTQVYHPETNPRQNAISSNVNVYVDARVGFAFKVHPKHELSFGGQIFHFSNAATKMPNSGMNFVGLHLGYTRFHRKKSPVSKDDFPHAKKEILIGFNGSAKQNLFGDPYDFLANTYIEYNRRLAPNYQLGLGANVFYEAYEKIYDRWATRWGDGTHPSHSWYDMLAGGVYINNEWMFNRFSAYFHFGVYAFGNRQKKFAYIDYNGDGNIHEHETTYVRSEMFHRLGFRYRLTGHVAVNLSMLTHFAKAQYAEVGLAVRL